jgi:hypothetical protein
MSVCVCVCVCSYLHYLACTPLIFYAALQASCHLWPVWLYHIFPHYLIHSMLFGKHLFNTECVFWFSLQILSKIFLILRWMYTGLHVKCPLFLSHFNQTWTFLTDFQKILKYEISQKFVQCEPCSSMQTDKWTDRQTDRHDKAETCFLQFCECP